MPERSYTVSQQEIERLRKQLGDLQRSPAKEPVHTQALIESMDRLYEALSRMIVILENANRAVATDALQNIKDEHVKLDKLLDQNEKLARAVVALADEVRSVKRSTQSAVPLRPIPVQPFMQPSTPSPASPAPSFTPPVHAPLPTPSEGHEETSFLAQPVMRPVPTSPAPSFMPPPPSSMPTAPSPTSSPSVPPPLAMQGPPGTLPPLPPMPALPPGAPSGAPSAEAPKRPILRSFG